MMRFIGLAAMALLGVWLVLPSRNWAGAEASETLIGECRHPGVGVFRLYIGIGDGDNSVTLRRPGLVAREKQIFFSEREPTVESIRCLDKEVVLENSAGGLRLDYSRAVTVLSDSPLLYFNGELSPPFMQPVRIVTLTMGWLLLARVASSGVRTFRRRQIHMPPSTPTERRVTVPISAPTASPPAARKVL
jgi:hypothetical protein